MRIYEDAAKEYSRRISQGEYIRPEVLNTSTVLDVLEMPLYQENIKACIEEQLETRAMVIDLINKAKNSGKYIAENRHTIDSVIEIGLMDSPLDFTVEFAKVLNKESKFPNSIRTYIRQLGMKAYKMTIEELIRESDPEMKELYNEKERNIRSRKN